MKYCTFSIPAANLFDSPLQVALLGKQSKNTPVKEIATMGANLVVAAKSDTVQACMSKMVARDIRHLPVVDEETGQVTISTLQQFRHCDNFSRCTIFST